MKLYLFLVIGILSVKIGFSQGSNCFNAAPFCTGTTYAFQNNVNGTSNAGPNYGCLTTQPNQAWYYMRIGTSGNINIGISQTTGPGGTGSGIDVDFICWGPYTSATGGCQPQNIVDCSYSPSPTETCTINGAIAGQYYMLLLTNFSNQPGYINFSQVGGSGSTDCSILCPIGSSSITPPAAALSCTSAAASLFIDESALPIGQVVTPCLMFQVPLTDVSGANILEIYEGGFLLGCFRPTVSASSCAPNQGTVPNALEWNVYASYLDPTQPHTFRICEDNSNSTAGNMSYKIFDCQKLSTPIAQGTWTVNTGAAYPGSCQSIVINPGAGAGQWNFTGSSSFTGPGISSTNWGAASFNPVTAGPGTHTITYNWNNGGTGTGLCTGTRTVAITVSNPFNAAFTTPGPFCAGAACTALTPQNTYGIGTNGWSGTGVSGTNFCPATSGVGSFPVTYSVGTTATCRSTVTNTVVVNSIPTANAGSTRTLNCITTNTTLAGSGGGSYSWAGPAGGIVSGGLTASPTISVAGNYSVTVTVLGCSNTSVVAVTQNTTAPLPTAINNTTLTCLTTTAILTGGGGGSYAWSGPSGIFGGTTSTPTVNLPGNYNVLVTAANGCTATANTTVSQNTTAPSPTAINSTTLTCITSTAVLTGGGGGTYAWSGPSGIIGGTTSTPTVSLPGTYNLIVTAANGCTATANTSVSQNTVLPTTIASTAGSITCNPSNTITLNSSLAGMNYTWTAPSGSSVPSGVNSQNATGQGVGTYTIRVINPTNGCTFSTTTSAVINTVVPIGVNAGPTSTISCASPSVTLNGSFTSPSGSTATWLGGVCGSSSSFSTQACAAGIYTLVVTNPVNSCTASATTQVFSSTGVPTGTIALVSNSITCTNSLVSISVNSTVTPISISWTGPGSISSPTSGTTTVNAGGTYNVLITNTSNSCTANFNVTVPTNTAPVTPTALFSGSITCTNTLVTLNSIPVGAGFTYTWTGAGILTGTNSASATVNTGGDHVISVTNTLTGCVGAFTLTVPSNTILPGAIVAPTAFTTSCTSPTVQFNASTTATNVSYAWTNTGGSINPNNTANPIANGGGTYSVTITDLTSGCRSITSATVIPDANAPALSISSTSLALNCNTVVSTASVSVSSSTTNLTYNWSPAPNTGQGTNVATFNSPGTYICTVTNSVNACSTPAQVVVSGTVAPVISAVNSATLTCSTTTANLTATVSPSSGVTYSWTGSGIVGSASGSSINVNQGGIFGVTVTNTTTGCFSTSSTTVTNNSTAPTITVTPTSTVLNCSNNSTISLNASSNSTIAPIWSTPTGTASNPVNANTPGNYIVTITDAISGCVGTNTIVITGGNITPTISTSATGVFPCGANSTTLTASSTNTNVTYSWFGPNSSSIVSGSNTAMPTISIAGSYSVIATDAVSGCTTVATVSVTQGNVIAGISATPTTGIAPLTVNFTETSTGANTFNWNFGSSSIPNTTNQNPSVIYNTNGTYTVTLIASSGPCSDTATVIIIVSDGLSLEIPNVFTPNDDGTNDVFTIKSTGVKEITLQVFNRWGTKLYEFTGPQAGWDGLTGPGAKAPDGTYFYFVKAIGFDDKEIEQHGTFNLFR